MNKIILAVLICVGLVGCVERAPTSDQVQNRQQEALAMQGVASVGLPAIVNFQEKRILKNIYELRDQQIVTITYTQDMNGVLHKMCDSIGYGIPAATQYTNPLKSDSLMYSDGTRHFTGAAVAQADPNGLFSPSTAEGTWVMCKDPNSTKVAPVYAEPRVIVSPFPLK